MTDSMQFHRKTQLSFRLVLALEPRVLTVLSRYSTTKSHGSPSWALQVDLSAPSSTAFFSDCLRLTMLTSQQAVARESEPVYFQGFTKRCPWGFYPEMFVALWFSFPCTRASWD